ncbi:MAG: hypothetical protein JKY08_11920 [Flavobacteriaceae bacterium]|nr:hypothetical protein [Flavobacteriaceae bacterium]
MKNIQLKFSAVLMLAFLSLLSISCNNDTENSAPTVTGVYKGTIVNQAANKSSTIPPEATATVRMHGEQIEVTFTKGDFHHTLLLDIFEDGDFVRPCLTGSDFENTYNHLSSGYDFMNGMMTDAMKELMIDMMGSDWSKHLKIDHTDTDDHYGFFNTSNDQFEYSFMVDQMEFHFNGSKKSN